MSASTLAQYHDGAGSYGSPYPHSSGRPRKLPPRDSIEGMLLIAKIRSVAGTDKLRSMTR